MPEILFGTAGIPHSAKARDSIAGIERIRELNLNAMELEFVRGVHMSSATAKEVKKAALENNVRLSVHAPYFINLNSKDRKKLEASKKRIFDSARIGARAGAKIVTFHPGYYQAMPKEQVFERVADSLRELLHLLRKEKIEIALAPETTGKKSQFGSLEETLQLCKEIPGLLPMIDFAHLHARENGKFKNKEAFKQTIELIPKHFLQGLQMHVSGINYSAKGERNHYNLKDKRNDFPFKLLLQALKEEKVTGTIICESPNLELDALLLQRYYNSL